MDTRLLAHGRAYATVQTDPGIALGCKSGAPMYGASVEAPQATKGWGAEKVVFGVQKL